MANDKVRVGEGVRPSTPKPGIGDPKTVAFDQVKAVEVIADELMKVQFAGSGYLPLDHAAAMAGGIVTRLRVAGIVG